MNNNYLKGQNVIKKLLDHNYQAYFVGGFVRDRLLGLDINDIDITTNALPSEVQNIFEKTRATGIKYGTVTVFQGAQKYELTTFRADMNYIDHRKPERVVFSNDLAEDLKRRDFTINALAMDLNEKIVDMFSGIKDLELKLIRAIGDPDIRFKEDALRILRAFRFVSKLGFDIEEKTFKSIMKNIRLLAEISNERILSELKKLLIYPYKEKALKLMLEANISDVFPQLEKGINLLSKHEGYEVEYLEFFALCFYLEKIDIPKIWRFSNKERAIINKIIELITVTENDQFNEMIIFRLGKDLPLMANNISRLINPSNNQENIINQIYDNLPIYRTCDLKFKGQDILELSTLSNAEIIGDIIDDITYQVISGQINNDYQEIKNYTMKILEKKYEKK
ncbi:MAG: CCA tRNA nucleotidyltransferase [Tenericutes bacterium]|nr:CCA tRNA nucleotidyltransferase [Mycoplasmatota bacterium]